jgi:glutaredoxin-like protein NrdH
MDTQNKLPITVYSKPACVQCNATYRWLDAHKIPYRVVNLQENEQALQMVTDMGYQQAPVVIIPFDYAVSVHHWSGFNPNLLEQLLVD